MSDYKIDDYELDTKDFDNMLRALNSVMMNTAHNRSYSDKEYKRAEKCVSNIKKSWKKYLTSALGKNFPNLNRINLTADGKEAYKKLRELEKGRDKNFSKLKDSINNQSIGLFKKFSPLTTTIIKIEDNKLIVHKTNQSSSTLKMSMNRRKKFDFGPYSLKSSLHPFGKGDLLNEFNTLYPKTEFDRDSRKKATDMVMQNDLSDEIKKEYWYLNEYKKQLEEIGNKYSNKCDDFIRCREALEYIEKYRYYFSNENSNLISELYNEISKTIKNLNEELSELEKEYNTKVDELKEKIYGKYYVDKTSALLHMLRTGRDSKGRELSKAQYKEIQEEVERISEEHPENFKDGSVKYEAEKERAHELAKEWIEKENERILEDEELTAEELGNRNRCYQLYVVRKNYENVVTKSMFKYLYDKYLKLGVNGEYVIEKIVEYYVESVEYFKEMQRINKESEFKDCDEYIETKLIEDKIIGKAR